MTYSPFQLTEEPGPAGPINANSRATPGETKQRFGRSYVAYNPSVDVNNAMPATWNLMYESEEEGGGGNPFDGIQVLTVVLAPDPNISVENPSEYPAGTLIYIGSDGLGYRSKADNLDTAKVAGALLEAAFPNTTAKYARNAVIDIFDTSIIDNNFVTLIPNQYYYLSAIQAGNYTLTPDTTNVEYAVVQVGLGISVSRMAIEVQQPTLA